MKVALVGAGNVGTAVAHLLHQKGHEIVGVASRSGEKAARVAQQLDSHAMEVDEFPAPDLVLFGVPDHALDDTAAAVAPVVHPGVVGWHFAGAFGVEPLRRFTNAGGKACATHPVQSCPNVDAAIARLPGSAWGVTGDDETLAWSSTVIEDDLGGTVTPLSEDARPLWHAAAVTTSNGLSALLAVAESMLSELGIKEPEKVLGPLAAGTLQNALEGGGGGATLTGPVVRGEDEVITRHVENMLDRSGWLLNGYRTVVTLIVDAARENGRITPAQAQRIYQLIDPA